MTAAAEVVRLRGAGGLGLAANRYGPPDGPVVLFLHGAGQTRHSWHRTAATVAQAGFSVLCVDHRGHGDSDWPEASEYEIEHFADDLEAILDTLDSPPVRKTFGGGIGHVLTHNMHHRAQAMFLMERLGLREHIEGDLLTWESMAFGWR